MAFRLFTGHQTQPKGLSHGHAGSTRATSDKGHLLPGRTDGIVRMHGRNAETWEKKGLKASSDRFNYDYSDEELQELGDKIKALSRQVKTVHANSEQQLPGSRAAEECADAN